MLISVGILFGLIFGWKGIKSIMIKRFIASQQQPAVTVSTMTVSSSVWQPTLKSVGSIRAKTGVNVTTELPGMVETIHFSPGAEVNKGDLLVQLNAATELGVLHALQAQVGLAKVTFQRDKAQYNVRAVSKQTVDVDEWNLKNLEAQVQQQQATVDKKTIKAPFSGRLGINNINPGQFINVGDTITTLQALDPVYADFYLPQQALSKLKLLQAVDISVDTFPNKPFKGEITTIQPAVDVATRNVLIEATVPNSKFELKPGMFAQIEVSSEKPQTYLTVPQSAVSFNPYGDIVYVVKDSGKKDSNNQPVLTAQQIFVIVGDSRGDQVAITKGLKAGDIIVTSGQLKLKNNSVVKINNKIMPSNDPAPKALDK